MTLTESNMYSLLIQELSTKGVSFSSGSSYFHGKQKDITSIRKELSSKINKNKKSLNQINQEMLEDIQSPILGDANSKITSLFIHAIKNLYSILNSVPPLEKSHFALTSIVNSDSKQYSDEYMHKFIDYNIAIQWLVHLIRQDMYTLSLIKHLELLKKGKKEVVARGFGGPWGRLDLPMEERTFEWSDVAEETAGRQTDKKMQRRYTMPLEQYQDQWPNEGFNWREIRNDPYLFDNSDDNPYPHRNLLWKS